MSSLENIYSSPFLNQIGFLFVYLLLFLLLSCVTTLHILDVNPLHGYIVCKHFLPFCFVDCFFCAGAFKFYVVSLVYFCFCCLGFWGQVEAEIFLHGIFTNVLTYIHCLHLLIFYSPFHNRHLGE